MSLEPSRTPTQSRSWPLQWGLSRDSSRNKSTTWQRNLTIPLIFNVIPLILTLISLIFNADSDEGLADGLNGPANHTAIVRNLERTLPEAARAGISNVITFVGNRRGMADAEGIDYCVIGLSRLAPVAENESVTIVVEMANSRVDHRDYHGDHIAFGVEVVERVTSPRVKLVYDVYDMQIIEGVIIRTIQANHASIGLYHTGGVPGRRELDRRQEINWRAVATAIVETGFTGYLAHEFVPTRDPIASLRNAVRLCDV